jgi:hypothetical protein
MPVQRTLWIALTASAGVRFSTPGYRALAYGSSTGNRAMSTMAGSISVGVLAP